MMHRGSVPLKGPANDLIQMNLVILRSQTAPD
jgi:hypothetical protein